MKPHFYSNNRITLLHSGEEYFPALEEAINSAQHEIFLETYIFAADATGKRIAAALIEAVKRGVVVHLLIDGFGSHELPASFRKKLEQGGVELLIFRPGIFPFVFRISQLRRLHRKLVVIDRAIAFIGGINIIDDIDLPDRTRVTVPRYDYAVCIQGPLTIPIHKTARRLWKRVAWANFKRYPKLKPVPIVSNINYSPGTQRAALVTRDNIRHRHVIEKAYLQAIESAKQEIIIANAYFFPGARFRNALIQAARRGVRVMLLLQGRAEYWFLHYASRGLYGPLLDTGVQIYDYNKGFLHAKVAVIDQHWATVGSSNIDPFSLLLAREANVVIDDYKFAEELREDLIKTIHSSATPVPPQQWSKQAFHRRAMIWINYMLFRIFTGIVGPNNY